MEPFSPLEPKAAAKTGLSLPEKKFRVLVGVTGSVAALKLPLLISELLKIPGVEVKVVTTERAKHFYNPQEIPVPLYSDEDEWQHRCERELISPLAVLLQMHSHASVAFMWRGAMARKLSGWSRRSAEVCWVPGCCSSRQSCSGGALCVAVEVQLWKGRSDPVLHIELRRWADLMLVAPLDANTLAKLATGICDNLLVEVPWQRCGPSPRACGGSSRSGTCRRRADCSPCRLPSWGPEDKANRKPSRDGARPSSGLPNRRGAAVGSQLVPN
uniref:Phosphopantothenoylcysteine decarboxylase n=1 Tax=Cairina moschata TaxID=8855 RepID=A0A8C3CMG5_CAIMO